MTIVKNNVLKAACLSLATIGATSFVITMATTDTVDAKGAKNGGKSNKGNRGKSNKPSNSRGSKASIGRGNSAAQEAGVHPSELGALNAANANTHALESASPNSRVGKIAIFRDAVLAGQQLDADLSDAQAALDAMDAPARTSDEIYAELLIAIADQTPTEDLQAEYDAALAYEAASAAVDDLAVQQTDQAAYETTLLEDAANKEVTPEVEEAVREMLGLNDEPAAGEEAGETAPEE